MAPEDKEYFGVFGPGDGKPVAVFDDHDVAARESRKRFGDRGNVFPVGLGGLNADQREAVKNATFAEEAGIPAKIDAGALHRTGIEAELEADIRRELLREQLRPEVEKRVKAELKELAKAEAAEAKAEAKADDGDEPTSTDASGPAPGAQEANIEAMAAPDAALPQVGDAPAPAAKAQADPPKQSDKPAGKSR